MRIARFAWVVSLAACTGASDSGPDQVPAGSWGGQHVALEVTAGGGSLEFDCAHATIAEPLRLEGGRFSVAGVYVREHGGPERVGEPEDSHPARFDGTLEGDRLTFSIRLTDDDATIGSFSVVQGKPPLVFKCG
jgi:hypothetical protein